MAPKAPREHKRKAGGEGKKGKKFLENKVGCAGKTCHPAAMPIPAWHTACPSRSGQLIHRKVSYPSLAM